MPQNQPIIEILGPWLQNNGDGLNLWAVADRLGGSATLAVSSTLGMDELPERPKLSWIKWRPRGAEVGEVVRARSVAGLARLGRDAVAATVVPRSMLAARGQVLGRHLTALVDCSGFAYGDTWSTYRVEVREGYYRRLREQGSLVIVLPQAFGPFTKPEVRQWNKKLFDQCDLIYARDTVSLEHLRELGVGERIPGVVPDITHLLAGTPPVDPQAWSRRVCIVPNARMLDKTTSDTSQRYKDFVLASIRAVRDAGLEPVLLIHEKNDLSLAQELHERGGLSTPIVNEDALTSKGILGASYAVIASRYHALISALSQGVPAVGTSWSHKYEELFGDYGCGDWLLSPEHGEHELISTLGHFLERGMRDALATRLAKNAERQKARVAQMWDQIEAKIHHR